MSDPVVRSNSICAGTSDGYSNVKKEQRFPRACEGEKDHWPTSRRVATKAKGEQKQVQVQEIGCSMPFSAQKYCDALTKTRYTVYAPGDTPTGNRFADAIDYGSIRSRLSAEGATLGVAVL